MANTFRIVALIFFVSPLAAMFSEPFFEAAFDLIGWDTESWAAPVMGAIMTGAAYIGSPALVSFTSYLAVLGLGVWIHFIATIKDRSKPTKSSQFYTMQYRIYNFRHSYSQLIGHWRYYSTAIGDKGRWSADLAAEYIALKNDLSKLSIELPIVDVVTSPDDWEKK